MRRKSVKWILIILLSLLLIIIGTFFWLRYDIGARIWYLLPSDHEFYVYLPTDMDPVNARSTTVTLTNMTGFDDDPIVAQYWEEAGCFHVVLDDRGIYEIKVDPPDQSALTIYMEAAYDEIFCISLIGDDYA